MTSGRGIAAATALALLLISCGPDVMHTDGSESGTGSGSEAGSSSEETGQQFICTAEELAPGYCFERYEIELPGPLVQQRAVAADIDGDGADELALELDLAADTDTLTVWRFDDVSGLGFVQELELLDTDFEQTSLIAGDRLGNGLDAILRIEDARVSVCDPDPDTFFIECLRYPVEPDRLYPIVFGHLFSADGIEQVVSVSPEVAENGLQIFRAGSGVAQYGSPMSTPPCEELIAVVIADVNGDGHNDIIHRSSVGCVPPGEPQRDDVGLYLGNGTEWLDQGPPADLGIEPTALATGDFDNDGAHEIVAAQADGSQAVYRLVSWEEQGWSSPLSVPGPASAHRLATADLRGDGSADLVFSGDVAHLSPSPLEEPEALPPELGPLLAVADVNGDGLDDLLLMPEDSSLSLLVSR